MWMRLAHDQAVAHQALCGARDCGGVHLESRDHTRKWKAAGATEREQSKNLETREGEPEGFQRCIHSGEHQLLCTHHRGDNGHAVGSIRPSVRHPLTLRFGERIDRQRTGTGHGSTLSGGCTYPGMVPCVYIVL